MGSYGAGEVRQARTVNRRSVLIAACVLVATPWRVLAQKSSGLPRIGVLWIDAGDPAILSKFRDGMNAQGYVDGKNISIDTQSLVDRYDRLPGAAANLVNKGVDVIVCYGATATLAASRATSTIPVVTVMGGNPVEMGLVVTLANPGRNVTGVTFLARELDGKRFEILREVTPQIRRVGLIYNPESESEAGAVFRRKAIARKMNLEVLGIELRLQSDIDTVVAQAERQKVDALVVVPGTMFVANRKQLVAAIGRTRLPAVFGATDDTQAGGLISYGPDVSDGFRRAAGHVARILKGAKPANLPFEQPTKFELAINLKTARSLGITVPQSLLLRADQVFE